MQTNTAGVIISFQEAMRALITDHRKVDLVSFLIAEKIVLSNRFIEELLRDNTAESP